MDDPNPLPWTLTPNDGWTLTPNPDPTPNPNPNPNPNPHPHPGDDGRPATLTTLESLAVGVASALIGGLCTHEP